MIENKTNDNSKQKIIAVATKLFAQKGFDGVSIRDICKQADINISMISYYFGGKKELYHSITETIIEKQTEYAKAFIDFDIQLNKLSKKEKIDMLCKITDKAVDFFYSTVSDDLILFLLKEQQNPNAQLNSPTINFVNKLIASIIGKKENDMETVLKTIFLISQISSPRIFMFIHLGQQEQKSYTKKYIQIIKDNLKKYIKEMF